MKFDLLRAIPGRLAVGEASQSPDARLGRRGFRHDGESSPLARWFAVSLLPLAALALGTGAQANTLTISANVQAACTATTAAIPFGTYNNETGNPTPTQFTINCTPGANVNIVLGPGQNPNGSTRQMKRDGSNDLLPYNLYKENTYTEVWGGDGSFGTAKIISGFEDTNDALQQVFGKIQTGQPAAPGNYSDTVAISFTFN